MAADRRAVIAMLALLALAACDAPGVGPVSAAYDPTQATGGVRYRWAFGREIAVYADTTGAPAGYDLRSAVAQAAGDWNAATAYGDFTLRRVDDARAADVIFHFSGTPRLVVVGSCAPSGGGSGVTVLCNEPPVAPVLPFVEGGTGHVKVDVAVDPLRASEAQLQVAGLTRAEHFLSLVVHEMGHVVGIGGHSSSDADVMNSLPHVTAPSAGDVRTLRAVLRRPADVRL
jgi:hypothetical protein